MPFYYVPEPDRSGLALGAKDLDLVFDHVDDPVCAGSEELAGIKALVGKILACFDVSPGRLCESDLALGVDVDLRRRA